MDKLSGKVRWKRFRDGYQAYTTPLVLRLPEGDQVISPGAYRVIAYEPRTGKELWQVKYGEGFSNVPRPVFGLGLDMIGNVWEWTADAFALYPGSTATMPEDVVSPQQYRIIRGGAYDVRRKVANVDNSYRGYIEGNRKDLNKTGFRCVKDANQ